MKKVVFLNKTDGEVAQRDFVIRQVDGILNTLPNGEYILSIERRKRRRSLPQNRLLWLWLTCIANETGNDRDSLHDYYCTKYLRKAVVVNGKEEVVVSGTSALTSAAFGNFLNQIQAHAAAELGITLPAPADALFAVFEDQYRQYL